MARQWWNPFDGMEELTFRPVEGGFLYRAPNPWLIGRFRHYFVNAEQKATLASAHRTMMMQLFWSIVIGAMACAPIAGVFLPSQSSTQQLAYLGVAALVGLAIGLMLNALVTVKPVCPTGPDIAQAVRSGRADCGIATRSVAQAAGLGFVPLTWERFDLALRQRDYFLPGPQALFGFMRTAAFRERAAELGGYDVSEAGAVRLVN